MSKKLSFEITGLENIEAIVALFKELLADYKSQAVAAATFTSEGLNIDHEKKQIDAKVADYEHRLMKIFGFE